MKLSARLAYLYFSIPVLCFVVLSIVGWSGYHPHFDCSDPTWDDVPSIAAREAIINHQTRFDVPVSKLMIVIGATLLYYLAYCSIKSKQYKKAVLPVVLVLLPITAYLLVIAITHGPWCT